MHRYNMENGNRPIKNKEIEKKFEANSKKMWFKEGKFVQEIWKCYKEIDKVHYEYRWYSGCQFSNLHIIYAELCGIHAKNTDTLDEFWNHKIEKAIVELFGKEEAKILKYICALILEAPYSHSVYRPSYRSHRAGDYSEIFFMAIVHAIDYLCYDISLADIIKNNFTDMCGFDNRLAHALRSGDKEVCTLMQEIIMEDSNIKLSNPIIKGIIKSGVPQQLENLGKLLLAAKGQEGLRQAILENADSGSQMAHAYFIKIIIDNNLARFSSVIRAFGTWTGLAYDDAKPAVIDKCMKLAYKYLSNDSRQGLGEELEEGLNGADTLEVYMALWAIASKDIYSSRVEAENLVNAPEKYRRLTGWYFLNSTIHHKITYEIAMNHISVREPEELAWICKCLYTDSEATRIQWNWENDDKDHKTVTFPDYTFSENKFVRQEQFNKLCNTLDFIGNKKTKFEGSIFPWVCVELTSLDVVKCMLGIVGYDRSSDMIQKLSNYLSIMDTDNRIAFYINLLNPDISEQRSLLINGLSDKSPIVKGNIVSRLKKESLNLNDIEFLTKALITQSAELRKSVMLLLGMQNDSLISLAIDILINSDNDKQLIAGLELLDIFADENPKLLTEYNGKIAELNSNQNISKDVVVILERFNYNKDTDFTPENGFGLYDTKSPDFDKKLWAFRRPLLNDIKIDSNSKIINYNKEELKELLSPSVEDWKSIIIAIKEVLDKYKGMECEVEYYDGSKNIVLIGDDMYRLPRLPENTHKFNHSRLNRDSIFDYYLADEIMAAFDSLNISPLTLATILCYGSGSLNYGNEFTPTAKSIFNGLPFEEKYLDYNKYVGTYSSVIQNILQSIFEVRFENVFDFAMSIWISLVSLVPESDYMSKFQVNNTNYYYNSSEVKEECMFNIGIISVWRSLAYRFIETDEQFTMFWNELWYEYLVTDMKCIPVYEYLDIFRAYKLGIITKDGLFRELIYGTNSREYIRMFTNSNSLLKDAEEKYPYFREIIDKVVERIVSVEERRGELSTYLSSVATQIGHFKGGAKHFTALLTALGKDDFHRGYVWFGHTQTKKTTLSILMKNCYPSSDDTYEIFSAVIKTARISEKRLLQAVMYAPQWADFVEKFTGISGLASTVWLFHAHINEQFNAEKETKVALYSPISQQEFTDGTFDKDWFLQSYNTIGEKYFNELYKNAKYITDSSIAHRRSQLYADAVLGKLDKSNIELEIIDKRNQEKLRAYALIPLDDKDAGDALKRYEFIQNFAKESKQFGSQRRASEDKAVRIALQNLAITTGFSNSDRMGWYLESEKMESLKHLMEPYIVGEINVWLNISEDGLPSIGVSKDGKILKSLPKAISKNETVLDIQSAVKDLRDQKKRAKLGFEMAMVSRTEFYIQEIMRLLQHPVLKDMISSLVFISKVKISEEKTSKREILIGFPKLINNSLYLISYDGYENELAPDNNVIIAHPHDLIQKKCWSSYQKYLYRNEIIQPFKQVFREYYPLTEDELAEVNISRRYAGHQVQPRKTVALLKTRGWTVDYEEGLQRVYHKENLIAKMYAMADWFSPADIEAPTLEIIQFYKRDNYETIDFKDVPPVIFSEIMRDIDLVVSVAHVGGVDPEASHSTVEMRIAIAKELLSMLAVDNVLFKTTHAIINGSKGEYSIHMGSGIVHQSGVGMLAVLPVHSQRRGRIFLPFVDDDPKTAEIMSKILLFAADKKIKDPSILRQMN